MYQVIDFDYRLLFLVPGGRMSADEVFRWKVVTFINRVKSDVPWRYIERKQVKRVDTNGPEDSQRQVVKDVSRVGQSVTWT